MCWGSGVSLIIQEGGGSINGIGGWDISERVAAAGVLVGIEESGVGLSVHCSIPAWKKHEGSCGVSISEC